MSCVSFYLFDLLSYSILPGRNSSPQLYRSLTPFSNGDEGEGTGGGPRVSFLDPDPFVSFPFVSV